MPRKSKLQELSWVLSHDKIKGTDFIQGTSIGVPESGCLQGVRFKLQLKAGWSSSQRGRAKITVGRRHGLHKGPEVGKGMPCLRT